MYIVTIVSSGCERQYRNEVGCGKGVKRMPDTRVARITEDPEGDHRHARLGAEGVGGKRQDLGIPGEDGGHFRPGGLKRGIYVRK